MISYHFTLLIIINKILISILCFSLILFIEHLCLRFQSIYYDRSHSLRRSCTLLLLEIDNPYYYYSTIITTLQRGPKGCVQTNSTISKCGSSLLNTSRQTSYQPLIRLGRNLNKTVGSFLNGSIRFKV